MTFIDYPGHLAAVFLLLILGVLTALAFYCRKLRTEANRTFRLILSLLQYIAIVILLLILWNPSLPKKTDEFSRNSVLALFDTSESMSVIDEGGITRLDKSINVFEEKFQPSNPKRPDYKIFGFDSKVYHSGSTSMLQRWGSQTNIVGVLELLNRYSAPDDGDDETQLRENPGVTGAVVFTDGRVTDKDTRAYIPANKEGFEIIFICPGSKTPKSDIAVRSISAPARAVIDTVNKVQVTVSAKNLQNQPVLIELFKDDRLMDSRQLFADKFNAAGDTTKIEFNIGADKLGRHTLSARAKALEGEINTANNVRNAIFEVIEQDKLKVLFYSEVANFDIGKVRQALARDDKIELDLAFNLITEQVLSEKARKSCGYLRLPNDANTCDYDLIIIGPCAIDSLPRAQIEGLYSFVVDRGGGLVVLPGREKYGPERWRNDKIKTLLPVFFAVADGVGGRVQKKNIELTPEGLDSKIITPADLRKDDWPASAYYHTVNKKPASYVFLTHDDAPIAIVHRIGRGRVCLLNSAELFKWYREDLDGGLLQRLMSGLTGYVARTTDIGSTIDVFIQRNDQRGDLVECLAYVSDKSFSPLSGANVLLSLEDKTLIMDDIGSGYYSAEIEGIQTDSIIVTVQAELNGQFQGERTLATNLPAVEKEMDVVEPDREHLRLLAEQIGAQYLDIDSIDEKVAQSFKSQRRTGSIIRTASIWPNWPLLLFLFVLLSSIWYIKRAQGLL